jgi:hypothetical protein
MRLGALARVARGRGRRLSWPEPPSRATAAAAAASSIIVTIAQRCQRHSTRLCAVYASTDLRAVEPRRAVLTDRGSGNQRLMRRLACGSVARRSHHRTPGRTARATSSSAAHHLRGGGGAAGAAVSLLSCDHGSDRSRYSHMTCGSSSLHLNVGHSRQIASFSSVAAAPTAKIFLRQGFTESGPEDIPRIQRIYNAISELAAEFTADGRGSTELLWPAVAWHRDNFQSEFTTEFGVPFTACNFWEARRPLIEAADVMICVRSCLSESTAMEIGYKLGIERSKNPEAEESELWSKIVIITADDEPIKTTMLRNAQVLKTSEIRGLFDRLHAPTLHSTH